ncbi:COG4223 family protein [Bartonella sp. CB169]|uniref:COG4223 family protein n=1 Tax=Bartonella sp. CB169 TaxID=3112257 RepID=UPI00300DD1BE
MADSLKPKVKPHYTKGRRKKTVIEHEVVKHDSEKMTQNFVAAERMEKKNMQSKHTSGFTLFFLLIISGILGALITLGLFIGLQWAGFLSSSLVDTHIGGEKALQIAETAKSQGEEIREQLGHVLKEIDVMKTKFSTFSSQQAKTAQDDEASKEKNSEAFAALEEKVRDLEEALQALVGVSKEIETALSVEKSNANDLAVLKKQLEIMQEEFSAKHVDKKEINVALFTAISSLKNAIERGGSYSNELKLLQQLAPSIDGLDLLQKTATVGLPSLAQLSADFSRIADAIVGTQNIVTADAGFFERALRRIKGLIVLRPIGNVEGMTLEAIAARMEVAIQAGDYEKALSEWQTLPQSAKNVSMNFAHQLETHIAVYRFLQQLLVSVQQGSFKETKM